MCVPNLEFQLLNPTTQVELFSLCVGDCTSIEKITWNIYYGYKNGSLNSIEWFQLNHNSLCFGSNTTNFTALDQLFVDNPQISYWKFEVVYSFPTTVSRSALNFIVNEPPANGSCSISPQNGTTSTVFQISCSDWLDDDGIKDYSVYSKMLLKVSLI